MQGLAEVYTFATQRRPDGLVIDTNVLILLMLGSYKPALIEKCELTHGKYSESDFQLLTRIIRPFKKVIITPQVIAELSNLALSRSSLSEPDLKGYFQTAITFFTKGQSEERYLSITEWKIGLEAICSYGFVDMGMYELSEKYKLPILTDDTEFYYFSHKKIPIIKFEHIRNTSFRS